MFRMKLRNSSKGLIKEEYKFIKDKGVFIDTPLFLSYNFPR